MSMRDAPAIHTTGFGKRYGSNWALQHFSVSVPRGHVTALVGANGAGKTTLLKLLVGLCAPSEVRPKCSDGYLNRARSSWRASDTWPKTCPSTSGSARTITWR